MTCLVPHDGCPLFEEEERHLSCAESDCDWYYIDIHVEIMKDGEGTMEGGRDGPIRE